MKPLLSAWKPCGLARRAELSGAEAACSIHGSPAGWRAESVSTDFHVLRRGFQSPAESHCAASADETATHLPPNPVAPQPPTEWQLTPRRISCAATTDGMAIHPPLNPIAPRKPIASYRLQF
ncbi:MAG TPA: hypothetical protein PLR65_01535 [Anaerolineales bacterium]|nr:hypothetical protein [Anaerolineales bacterium]